MDLLYSNPDTNWTEECVHISEVSLFHLGEEKVSLLQNYPHFKSVLREGLHYMYVCLCVSLRAVTTHCFVLDTHITP